MDYTFEDLIKINLVKNDKGECYARCNGEQSIMHCNGVKSERGLYRVWISNLQKMIRRGRLNEAITSMIECVETGKVFKTNVINRMAKVIVSEDIGLANPRLPIYCSNFIKKKDVSEEDLIELTTILVKSKKSRLTDNLYFYCEKDINNTFEESFEYIKKNLVVLKDTTDNVDVLNLVDIITHLNNCINKSKTTVSNINILNYKKRQQIYFLWNFILEKSGENVYDINKALLEIYISQEKNDGKKLNMIQAILNVIYSDKIKREKYTVLIEIVDWKRDLTIWPWSISYDKHSIKEYYRINRGSEFFFKYGAQLENKSEEEWIKNLEEKFKVS